MKSLLFVNYASDISGSSVALKRLVLACDGVFDINVITPRDSYLASQVSAQGVRVIFHDIPILERSLNPIRQAAYVNSIWNFRKFILKNYRETGAELLLINCLPNLAAGLFSLPSVRVAWWVHELYLDPAWLLRRMTRQIEKRANHIMCVSREVQKLFRFPTTLLPNGVRLPEVSFNKNPFTGKSLRFLWVGTVSPRKGLHRVGAYLKACRGHWENISLTVCGSVSPKYREYYEKCTEEILECGIRLEIRENTADDKIPWEQAFIFLQTSVLPESFSLPVLEAMSNGLLVISSNLGGVNDFGMHMENLLFLQKLEDTLPEVLLSLSQDPGRVLQIQKNARYTAERYRLENLRENFRKIVEQGADLEVG